MRVKNSIFLSASSFIIDCIYQVWTRFHLHSTRRDRKTKRVWKKKKIKIKIKKKRRYLCDHISKFWNLTSRGNENEGDVCEKHHDFSWYFLISHNYKKWRKLRSCSLPWSNWQKNLNVKHISKTATSHRRKWIVT